MKQRPRLRRMVKWGGVVVTALLVVVWIGTEAYSDVYVTRPATPVSWWWVMGTWSGQVHVHHQAPMNGGMAYPGFHHGPNINPYRWGFELSATDVTIPLWFPALIALGVAALAWCAEARARRGSFNTCPACGYDRTGLAAGVVCPECGSVAGVLEGRHSS